MQQYSPTLLMGGFGANCVVSGNFILNSSERIIIYIYLHTYLLKPYITKNIPTVPFGFNLTIDLKKWELQ